MLTAPNVANRPPTPAEARGNTYTIYELPFTARPQWITIKLVGVDYRFKLAWNKATDSWVIDMSLSNGTPLINGMPLVTGIDLLFQYKYLEIGGQLFVITDQTAMNGLVPTFDNLGITGHVFFLPDTAQPI